MFDTHRVITLATHISKTAEKMIGYTADIWAILCNYLVRDHVIFHRPKWAELRLYKQF